MFFTRVLHGDLIYCINTSIEDMSNKKYVSSMNDYYTTVKLLNWSGCLDHSISIF